MALTPTAPKESILAEVDAGISALVRDINKLGASIFGELHVESMEVCLDHDYRYFVLLSEAPGPLMGSCVDVALLFHVEKLLFGRAMLSKVGALSLDGTIETKLQAITNMFGTEC